MSERDYFKGISLQHVIFHPAVWFIVATAAMIFGATHLWDKHRYDIAHPSKFEIRRENVQINDPPSWFGNKNLYDELHHHVFNSSTLLDQHVVPATAEYLVGVPWIQRVKNVNKNPSGLSISLKYRNPIAFVTNQKRDRSSSETIVDSEGVVFDSRLLIATDASRLDSDLFRITMPGVDISDLQPWQISTDERIAHAARLCEFLTEQASDLQLYRVVTFDLPSLQRSAGPEMEIWTRNGVRVLWGNSPGSEEKDEAQIEEKLKALRAFVTHHGPLELFENEARQMIDVRSGIAQIVEKRRFAEMSDIFDSIK